jgi:hypothetical protein
MNSDQSIPAPTGSFDHTFGGGQAQDFQHQNQTSWPTSSYPPMALGLDANNPESSPVGNVPPQSSGPLEDNRSSASFSCEICSKVYSKQYELTLVLFPTL